jgi:hypothetical protein
VTGERRDRDKRLTFELQPDPDSTFTADPPPDRTPKNPAKTQGRAHEGQKDSR